MKKRFMSILLTLCMVMTLLPMTVFAANTAKPSTTTTGATPKVDAKETGESWSIYHDGRSYGYKDAKGNVVIPARFVEAELFSEGIACVKEWNSELYGFIDTTGKLVTPLKYTGGDKVVRYGLVRVSTYSDEVLKAIQKGDSVNYIEQKKVKMHSGKTYDYVHKEGFIDTTGKEVIPPQFDSANSFVDGMAAVYKYQGSYKGYSIYKIGYINTKGKLVIPYKYGGDNSYDWSVFNYKDGLVCFFNYLGESGLGDGWAKLPPGGIMDKTGKVIIPANKDRWYPSSEFGLQWKDGVIAVTYVTEVNAKGVPQKGGGHEGTFSELYDYSGKLIKKLDGYTYAWPFGGGYTLALRLLSDTQRYWTVFDKNGKAVIDQVEKNNFDLFNQPMGYGNGYIYFGSSCYNTSTWKKADMQVNLSSKPTKTSYTVGEGFDASGINVVLVADGKTIKSINDEIRYKSGVTITQRHPFTEAGKKTVEVLWEGVYKTTKVGEFTINVSEAKAIVSPTPKSGDREITVEVHNPTTSKWDAGQGDIKYTVNGGSDVTLLSGAKGSGTPKKLTFSASAGDKVQIIWTPGKFASEAQVFAYYSDTPASNINDSSRVLGWISVGEATANVDNAFTTFKVGDKPSTTTQERKMLPNHDGVVLTLPTKKKYKVGENFSSKGASAILYTLGRDRAHDTAVDVTNKLTFYCFDEGITLTPGKPIKLKAGTYRVQMRYDFENYGIDYEMYSITISK